MVVPRFLPISQVESRVRQVWSTTMERRSTSRGQRSSPPAQLSLCGSIVLIARKRESVSRLTAQLRGAIGIGEVASDMSSPQAALDSASEAHRLDHRVSMHSSRRVVCTESGFDPWASDHRQTCDEQAVVIRFHGCGMQGCSSTSARAPSTRASAPCPSSFFFCASLGGPCEGDVCIVLLKPRHGAMSLRDRIVALSAFQPRSPCCDTVCRQLACRRIAFCLVHC